MLSLYNCRHDGDQFRITKFDSDFNPEASYLLDASNCECPAGHRPTCRHRQMLPKFIARNAVGTNWFFDHDRGGWVQGWKEEPECASEALLILQETGPSPVEQALEKMKDFTPSLGWNDSLAPAGLGQPTSQEPSTNQFTNPLAEGVAEFSGVVTPTVGNEDEGSIPYASPTSASGPSPSPTIRRRV